MAILSTCLGDSLRSNELPWRPSCCPQLTWTITSSQISMDVWFVQISISVQVEVLGALFITKSQWMLIIFLMNHFGIYSSFSFKTSWNEFSVTMKVKVKVINRSFPHAWKSGKETKGNLLSPPYDDNSISKFDDETPQFLTATLNIVKNKGKMHFFWKPSIHQGSSSWVEFVHCFFAFSYACRFLGCQPKKKCICKTAVLLLEKCYYWMFHWKLPLIYTNLVGS